MDFFLNPKPTFNCPVTLSVPEGKGTADVEFTFNYKDKEALDAWFKKYKNKPTVDALLEVINGWGVLDDAGAKAEISKDNLIILNKKYPRSLSEILTAYLNALQDSRAKN